MLNLIVAEIQDSKYLPLPLISFVCRVTSHKSRPFSTLYTLHSSEGLALRALTGYLTTHHRPGV